MCQKGPWVGKVTMGGEEGAPQPQPTRLCTRARPAHWAPPGRQALRPELLNAFPQEPRSSRRAEGPGLEGRGWVDPCPGNIPGLTGKGRGRLGWFPGPP